MSKTQSLFLAAAVASLIAAPVLAMELTTDAKLGAAPEDMSTVTMMEDSAFKGNEVRTKDQVVIGLVEGVYQGADGAPVALIAINSDIAAKSSVKTFTLPLPADATADGSLTLGWTEAELFTALSGQLEPASNG
jgi:hypothetical protein